MSPRTSKQYEEIREEKMALIMNTALEHFANEGYFSTTINHIARHAGISKGLLYNYFESKESLLKAIINKSIAEMLNYFDIDRDGYLSEEEFEFFIRKINVMLREKRSFWRLLFQLLMQNDVREQFLKSFAGTDSREQSGTVPGLDLPASQIMNMITDYFIRRKEKMGEGYDPLIELRMFLITIKGFAITSIYADDGEDDNNEKAINRIIELYK
jgi:AcrR family transcriptional regulator